MRSIFLGSCFLLCFMGGCWKKLIEKIDIDLTVDYVQTHSDGSISCIELIELDNIEEALGA